MHSQPPSREAVASPTHPASGARAADLAPALRGSPLRAAAYALFLAVLVGWILYVGKGIFVPIVLSVLVVYVIDGLARLVTRIPGIGPLVPAYVRFALSIVLIVLILAFAARMLMASLNNVVALAPQYETSLLNLIQSIAQRVGVEAAPTWDTLRRDLLAQISIQRLVGSTFVSVSAIAGSLVAVLLYGAFLLVEKHSFARKLARMSADPARTAHLQRIIADVNGRIGAYLALKTVVSIAQGLVSWAIMSAFDLQFAGFWAVLIGLLNYVPYLGTVLSVFFPVAFATMQFADPGPVLALLAALSVAQFFIGFFLDPWLMGSSLNLSPFVILVSITVWGALWGIPGAFLAVPVTACMAMVFAEFDATRPLAVLLSRNGELAPES
ncbi:MAG: AI-2E family transporter [Burkholderiales bacterium]|nr:AI-2E family transporter [Burkholderiales bacterium]